MICYLGPKPGARGLRPARPTQHCTGQMAASDPGLRTGGLELTARSPQTASPSPLTTCPPCTHPPPRGPKQIIFQSRTGDRRFLWRGSKRAPSGLLPPQSPRERVGGCAPPPLFRGLWGSRGPLGASKSTISSQTLKNERFRTSGQRREALRAANMHCDLVAPPATLAQLLSCIFDAADEEGQGMGPKCDGTLSTHSVIAGQPSQNPVNLWGLAGLAHRQGCPVNL